MEARTDGKTPWPEYTNARMPSTAGMAAQLAADVAAPGGKLPAKHFPILSLVAHCIAARTSKLDSQRKPLHLTYLHGLASGHCVKRHSCHPLWCTLAREQAQHWSSRYLS